MNAPTVVWTPTVAGGGTLCLSAQLEQLPYLMERVQPMAEAAGLSAVQQSRLELAVEEAFVNVCHYAYKGGMESGEVSCHFTVQPEGLTVEIVDQGLSFDPLARPDPDTALDLMDRQPGGLGVFLIKQLVDEAHYRREDERNILVIEMRRSPGDAGE